MRINFSYPTREQIIEGVRRLGRAMARYRAGERGKGDG
jgi:DNA-binding transcriptional MocR family regulator